MQEVSLSRALCLVCEAAHMAMNTEEPAATVVRDEPIEFEKQLGDEYGRTNPYTRSLLVAKTLASKQ